MLTSPVPPGWAPTLTESAGRTLVLADRVELVAADGPAAGGSSGRMPGRLSAPALEDSGTAFTSGLAPRGGTAASAAA
jgi:hypothetical protein